jgi:hypothetical protein
LQVCYLLLALVVFLCLLQQKEWIRGQSQPMRKPQSIDPLSSPRSSANRGLTRIKPAPAYSQGTETFELLPGYH